jgi:hypothetical protein
VSDVWVKVKLPGELHDKFRRYAFNASTSMQSEIVALVERLVSCDYPKDVPVKPESPRDCVEKGKHQ